jgi:hypothetical protein
MSPSDRRDLRKTALAAEAYLLLDAARYGGFIESGPEIDVQRCEDVIAEARAAGVTYTSDEIEDAALTLIAWHNATPAERAAVLGEDE